MYTTSILLVIDLKSGKSIKERIKIEISDDSSLILKRILKTWDKIIQNQKLEKTKIKKLAISFHNLQEESNQLTFGDFNEQRKRQRISRVIDYINNRLGKEVITSNLVFSKWNQIFQDEMTTTAAIDRLVHHATILELNTESYRMNAAKIAKNHSYKSTKKERKSDVK